MRAALRVAWAMTSLAVLVQGAAVTVLILVMGTTGDRIFAALIPMPVAVMLVFLARRIALVAESGLWRWVPGGPRTLVRGTALVLLAATLWLGGLYAWVAPQAFAALPFGHVLALWPPFTMLGFALRAGAGRKLPAWLSLVYVVVCVSAFQLLVSHYAHEPKMVIAMVIACAVAWLVAAFGKLPRGFASTASTSARRPAAAAVLANRTVFGRRSPALTLLRTGKGSGSLAVSVLVLVGFSVVQNLILGGHDLPAANYRIQAWMTLWASAAFVFALGTPLAERSRRLWLHLGETRGDVFRICERLLLRDGFLLALCGWLVVVLLGAWRGLTFAPDEAARLFGVYLGSALLPIYLSLALSTLHSAWLKVPAALLAVLGLSVWPLQWLRALGVTNSGFGAEGPGSSIASIAALLAVAAALRWFALRRWRTIDWALFRPRRLA